MIEDSRDNCRCMDNQNQYPRGSEWRKWDLQVQTVLDERYCSIEEYWDDLEKSFPEKCQELISIIGSKELIKKFDSKAYFFTNTDSKNVKAANYAKLFLNYLDVFIDDAGAICLTDHNYDHDHLLDAFVSEAKNTRVKVIPGIEINVQGVHMIVMLDHIPYGQTNYSVGIKTLLTKLNIHNKKTNGTLTISDKSYKDVLKMIDEIGGLLIYPHCNSDNGLFQERGKTDRTQLADQFNAQKVNILQSKHKKSADTTTGFILQHQDLKAEFVFTLGSDSRCLKDVFSHDGAGNYCWVKADPTFEGLKQVVFEKERVFIGEEPPILSAVRNRPTKFIRSLAIDKATAHDQSQGTWFDKTEFPLSSELVSIIGNKGSGKSAIADILGLIGNTPNNGHFSFLDEKRFKKGNLAGNFQATLTWVSGESESKLLSENVDLRQPETIKYLPQNYFENLCNDLNDETFGKELEEVVFSHLTTDKRLDQKTFADLIEYKSLNITNEINTLKSEIEEINRSLVSLEAESHPDYRTRIENLKKQKELEIAAHEKSLPVEVKDPSKESGVLDKQKQDIESITKINSEIKSLEEQRDAYTEKYNELAKELEDLKGFKQALEIKEEDIADFQEMHTDIVKKYFSAWGKLITFKVNYKQVDSMILEKEKKLSEYGNFLMSSDSLNLIEDETQKQMLAGDSINIKIERKLVERDAFKQSLDIPTRKYQAYLEVKAKWDSRKNELLGDQDTPATLKYFDARIKYLENQLPDLIREKRKERLEKTVLIFEKKKEVVEIYQTVKDSIDAIIKSNQGLLNEYKIVLNTGFVFSEDFETRFFSFVNQQVKGSFRGVDEGRKMLKTMATDVDLNNVESVKLFLNKILSFLEEDQRSEVKEEERRKYISDQIEDQNGFFDYIFSLDYFNPKYQLQLDAKNIDTLSPGEKGALLLVFYLMLDKNDIPLVIDQPEDNLDNKSVSRILVPFIKQAKQRRQIIMVTHNPNLAVVADAEQIIYVNIDKANGNAFSSSTGAIENPEMNQRLVDILEGTRPAFDKRRLRYKQNES